MLFSEEFVCFYLIYQSADEFLLAHLGAHRGAFKDVLNKLVDQEVVSSRLLIISLSLLAVILES